MKNMYYENKLVQAVYRDQPELLADLLEDGLEFEHPLLAVPEWPDEHEWQAPAERHWGWVDGVGYTYLTSRKDFPKGEDRTPSWRIVAMMADCVALSYGLGWAEDNYSAPVADEDYDQLAAKEGW